eukprot:CAMPEP_0196578856 /NCGR_PEP_ID=MMETSP1081-20130531/11405_1 /TAXON_ID=36882 /ORGANISM="Pyramimonas amylifera, Strain CCMP720" /LENGTH=329 /DNA_ID=CAMNT_0041898227 /DNA_START=102 /DNA_END=1091 /DNA_ORIENTATION=+
MQAIKSMRLVPTTGITSKSVKPSASRPLSVRCMASKDEKKVSIVAPQIFLAGAMASLTLMGNPALAEYSVAEEIRMALAGTEASTPVVEAPAPVVEAPAPVAAPAPVVVPTPAPEVVTPPPAPIIVEDTAAPVVVAPIPPPAPKAEPIVVIEPVAPVVSAPAPAASLEGKAAGEALKAELMAQMGQTGTKKAAKSFAAPAKEAVEESRQEQAAARVKAAAERKAAADEAKAEAKAEADAKAAEAKAKFAEYKAEAAKAKAEGLPAPKVPIAAPKAAPAPAPAAAPKASSEEEGVSPLIPAVLLIFSPFFLATAYNVKNLVQAVGKNLSS